MRAALWTSCGIVVAAAALLWLGPFSGAGADIPEPIGGGEGLRLRDGARQVYAVDVRTDVQVGVGDDRQRWQHRIRGRLDLQVARGGSTPWRLAGRLLDPVQEVGGEAVADPMLGAFFSVDVDAAGRMGAFEFAKGMPAAPKGQVEGLLRLFQVVVPAGRGDSWKVVEGSQHGPCTVVYRRTQGGLSRARVGYVPADGTSVQVHESRGAFVLASSGAWLERADVVEEIEVRGAQAQAARARTTGELRMVEAGVAPLVVSDQLAASQTEVSRLRAQSRAAAPEPRPATEADRRAFLALFDRLDGASRPDGLLDELVAAMLAHPELCGMVLEQLRSGRRSDLCAATVIHALKLAGHVEAQAALADAATEPRVPQRDRVRAVIDLGGVAEPVAATQQRLWELSETGGDAARDELSSTATLALGRLGRTMRELGDEQYPALRERLRGSLHAAVDAGRQGALLTAAGNTADPELREVVAGHLQGGDPGARAAAAKALGRIPESQALLLRGLAQEANARVRSQIAQGLLQQGELGAAPLQIVVRQLGKESDESARFAMARLVGARAAEDTGAADALRRLMRTESSARIRRYVAGRLAGLR